MILSETEKKLCEFVKKFNEDKKPRPLREHLAEALLEQIMKGEREITALITENATGNVYVCFSFTKDEKEAEEKKEGV